jgi:hypothetical protein
VIDKDQCKGDNDELKGTKINEKCRYYEKCKVKCEKIEGDNDCKHKDRSEDCLWLLGVLGTETPDDICIDKV